MPEISRFYGLVIKMIYKDELYEAWNQAVRNIPFSKIDPLK